MNVIPINRTSEEPPEYLFETQTPEERDAQLLAIEFPQICNDVAMLVNRPFRFVWDPTTTTASTDCLSLIRLSPWFFLQGEREAGYGTVYHETGHIRHSPYGLPLLARAHERGGELLQNVVNILLDRKDDWHTVKDAPGFADRLHRRLVVIATLARRDEAASALAGLTKQERDLFLKHLRPRDVYEDFFYAAKWHKRPRFKATYKAMKYLTRKRLTNAHPDLLLWTAEKVVEILGQPRSVEDGGVVGSAEMKKQVELFIKLVRFASNLEHGDPNHKLDSKLAKLLRALTRQFVDVQRKSGLKQLEQMLQQVSIVHPGPISVGVESRVPIKEIKLDLNDRLHYELMTEEIRSYLEPLQKKLRSLDSPTEFTLYGQEEGDLDLSESARIATGLPGIYMETVEERNIDAEIHLAVDCSGSMTGDKVRQAKLIATLFAEAVNSKHPDLEGRVWAFSSQAIYDLGPTGAAQSLVRIQGEGGNSDTHMLRHVGARLAKSQKKRRVLIVLCDDGPDDVALAGRLSRELLARGIIVIHLLVGVHGTPQIYPVELLYESMENCLEEFGTLLETIIKNLK